MRIGSSVGTMKIGSTAVAAIKRGTDRVYDADVAAFQKASAAADVSGIMDLVDYLKTESLWDYARFYPMKSAQNAGTGSTVYGLGGLTSNNMTLVNSPTWGSDGVTFDGSTQYGASSSSAIGSADELAYFLRSSPTLASAADTPAAIWLGIGNIRNAGPTGTAGLLAGITTSATSGETWSSQYTLNSDTGGNGNRIGTSLFTWTAGEDHTHSVAFGDGLTLWKNKASVSMDKNNAFNESTPCAPTDIGTTGDNFYLSGYALNGTPTASATSGVVAALLVFASSAQPTTTQRETITDLINAL